MYRYIKPSVGKLPQELINCWKLIPKAYQFLLSVCLHTSTPYTLRKEIKEIAKGYGVSNNQALAANLHYELMGCGCISAALPNPMERRYNVFRQLEWWIPDEVKSNLVEKGGIETMQMDGSVGCYDGRNIKTDDIVAFNLPPNYHDSTNYFGVPASWLVRKYLQEGNIFSILKGEIGRAHV